MARTLLGEIVHQIFGTRSNPKYHYNNKGIKDYERAMYKLKQAAFENKKAYEIAQTRAYIKGWKK